MGSLKNDIDNKSPAPTTAENAPVWATKNRNWCCREVVAPTISFILQRRQHAISRNLEHTTPCCVDALFFSCWAMSDLSYPPNRIKGNQTAVCDLSTLVCTEELNLVYF